MLVFLFLPFFACVAYASTADQQATLDLKKLYIDAMKNNDHQALDEVLPLAFTAGLLKFEEDMMEFRPGILYALQNPIYSKFTKGELSGGHRGRIESLMTFQWHCGKLQFPLLHQIHQAVLVSYPYVIYLLEPKLKLYKYKHSEDLFFCHSLQVAFYRYLYDNVITDRNPDSKATWKALDMFGDLLLEREFAESNDSVENFCKLLLNNRAKTDPSIRFALALYGYLDLEDMKSLFAMAIENKEYFTATAALKSLHAKYQVGLEDNEEVQYDTPIAKFNPKHYIRCKKNAIIANEPDLQVDLIANNAAQKVIHITSDSNFYHLLVQSLPGILETGNNPELVRIIMENFDIQAKDIISCKRLKPYWHKLVSFFPVDDLSLAHTFSSDNLIVLIAGLYLSKDPSLIQAADRLLPYLGDIDHLLIILRTKKIKKLFH